MSQRLIWWMGSIGLLGTIASVCYCSHLAGRIGLGVFGVPWVVACVLDGCAVR